MCMCERDKQKKIYRELEKGGENHSPLEMAVTE